MIMKSVIDLHSDHGMLFLELLSQPETCLQMNVSRKVALLEVSLRAGTAVRVCEQAVAPQSASPELSLVLHTV